MRGALAMWIALSGLSLAGCSIHPVQQEVTGLRSADLVKQIRCETRLAIGEKAARLLEQVENDKAAAFIREIPARLPRDITRFLTKPQLGFYDKYINTAIAYDFTFDIYEENIAGANIDPIGLISRGTFGVSFGPKGTYRRNNLRRFVFSERFEQPLFDPLLSCEPNDRAENFAYPISGRIGMFEVIDTFIDLNQSTQLATIDKGVNVFADTLKFTTTVIASATPKVVLNPIGRDIGLTGTSFTASAERQDDHQLIVGLSFPSLEEATAGGKKAARANVASPGAPAVPRTKSSQEDRALGAVIDQRYNTFLDRFGRTAR